MNARKRGFEKTYCDSYTALLKKAKIAAMEKAAAERKAAADAAAAEKEAAAAAKAQERAAAAAERAAAKPAPAPAAVKKVEAAPAPAPAKPAPAATKKVEAPKPAKTAPKKAPAPGVGDYLVGNVTVAALAAAAALALLVPGVKSKALEGDVEGALEDAKGAVAGVDGLPGKAAYVGGVVLVDAVAPLPVLGALVPGPAEFVGTGAAVLLAARYFVTKESTPEEDLEAFGASLPGELPKPGDIGTILSPASNLAKNAMDADLDILQDDVQQAPARLQRWFQGLENPVETIAPPAAALGATVVAGQVANLPVLALALPRLLELVGVAYALAAVNKYGGDEGGSLKEDLAAAAKRGGDAVKALAGKK